MYLRLRAMKKILYLLLTLSLLACNKLNEISPAGRIFQGTHILRKFNIITNTTSKWNGSYFLIAGSVSGVSATNNKVSFSWKLNSDDYAISEIELSKIRVHIDNSIDIPYVKFKWQSSYSTNLTKLLKYNVNYMIIYCKEEDYPINIQLNQL